MKHEDQYDMPLYKLKKDIPLCKKGTIFYYDKSDHQKGSIGAGCLKLAWAPDGNCQNNLCADTIVFHATAKDDKKWFEKMTDGTKVLYAETDIEYNGQKLYRKICNVD